MSTQEIKLQNGIAEMPEIPIFNSLDPNETKRAVVAMLRGKL